MNKIAFEVPQDYTLTRDRDSLKLIWHIECDSDQTLQTVRTLDGVPRLGAQSPLAPNLFASKSKVSVSASKISLIFSMLTMPQFLSKKVCHFCGV